MTDHESIDQFPMPFDHVAHATWAEEVRQNEQWGQQDHPDGTGPTDNHINNRLRAQSRTYFAFRKGEGTWRHILEEEVAEAIAESDPEKLKAELIQVAAVCQQWVRAINRREKEQE